MLGWTPVTKGCHVNEFYALQVSQVTNIQSLVYAPPYLEFLCGKTRMVLVVGREGQSEDANISKCSVPRLAIPTITIHGLASGKRYFQ